MATTGRLAIFLEIYIDDDYYKEVHQKKNMHIHEEEINLIFEPEEK